ncbi:hypothetical protein SAMN05421812_105438 [Asanoa hainanensis]|uniref:Uncharacterized protein n=1 Tax=Asanoa hainanensis TaxID=560556 RepID=A0A239MFY8_9ACTN|nr:hypothetical protein [Asanoa hainanensis]SNT41596.1 hypothetical protein SAMN05421812_105438 [Asanoa hainanensis]
MTLTSGQPRAPIIAAAREVAADATLAINISGTAVASPPVIEGVAVTGDPLDALVDRVRETAGRAVDALQVAALLEADGITDRVARAVFGFTDVFYLAEEVFRRAGGGVRRLRPVAAPLRDPGRAAREIAHGALYLLPGALFPAVAAVIAPQVLVVALLVAGVLGWVWAAGASWLAFQCLNVDDDLTAGRVLAWSTGIGMVVAALAGLGVTMAVGGGVTAAALVPGVMAYQMASTALVFYKLELWLALLTAPAAVLGIGYLLGDIQLVWALGTVSACVGAALAAGIWFALRAGKGRTVSAIGGPRGLFRGRIGPLAWVLLYSALAAVFLLHAQVPYLLSNVDVVLVVLALIVTMGVVEWRSRRFMEEARRLLTRVRYPREFQSRVWLLLAGNLAACWLATAVFATAICWGLWSFGRLSPDALAMAGAQIAMAGAYLTAFVLAGQLRYGWLCGCLTVAIAASLGTPHLIGASSDVPTTFFYLGSAVLLQILLLVGLTPVLGQVSRYR